MLINSTAVKTATILLIVSTLGFASAFAQQNKSGTTGKHGTPRAYGELLRIAQQALVVTTPDWNSVDGSLARLERRNGKWQQVGSTIPVVVGKSGLGWDGA